MIRRILFLIGCLALSLSAHAQSKEPLKVGFIIPLSGPIAEFGLAMRNGLELQKLSHQGVSPLTFLIEDSAYDNAKAVSAFNKLRNIDRADLIEVWGYGPSQAVIPLAERRSVPVIASSAETEVANGKRYVIRFYYPIVEFSDALFGHARQRDWKRIAVVKTDVPYMNGLYAGMLDQKRPDEELSLIADVTPTENDFRNYIPKIRSGGFDAVAVFLFPGQIETFYNQAANLGLKLPSLGTDCFDSAAVVSASGALINEATFVTSYVDSKFRDKYVKRFGNDSQLFSAANVFDLANLLEEEISHSGRQLGGEELLERLRLPMIRHGVSGSFSYRSHPRFGEGYALTTVLKRVVNNKIEELATAPR